MNKIILSIVMMLAFVFGTPTASAQEMVSVFNTNNVTIGVNGGVQTNLHDWNTPQGAVAGLTVSHQFNPVFGTTFDFGTGFNNRMNWYAGATHMHNGTAVDQFTAFLDLRANLMNWIGGFTGSHRVFEVEPLVGMGYGHAFGDFVNNVALAKGAIAMNFNLNRHWALNVTPAVVFNLTDRSFMSSKHAVFQVTAGVSYAIAPYWGGQTERLVYTQSEMDAINALVNELRAAQPQVVVEKEVVEVVRVDTVYVNRPSEATVAFSVNSAKLPAYVPALDELAKSIDAETMVCVTGYASEEGNAAYNKILSIKRSEAVKAYLVKQGVDPDHIEVVGEGATTKFGSNRSYNRVVVVKL